MYYFDRLMSARPSGFVTFDNTYLFTLRISDAAWEKLSSTSQDAVTLILRADDHLKLLVGRESGLGLKFIEGPPRGDHFVFQTPSRQRLSTAPSKNMKALRPRPGMRGELLFDRVYEVERRRWPRPPKKK